MVGNRKLNANILISDHYHFDVIIGMEWLSTSYVVIDCHWRAIIFEVSDQKEFEFLCHSEILELVLAKAKPTNGSLTTLDLREGQIPIVFDFTNVFFEEYGLPPKKSVELSINLIPRGAPISRALYRMSWMELEEVKTQVDDMLGKRYIKPNVPLWGAPELLENKKVGTKRLHLTINV